MKMYKVSSLGSSIVFSECAEAIGAVKVMIDPRDGVEYSFETNEHISPNDLYRAIGAYLFFVKGLPSSLYTVSVNGALIPIPVPKKCAPVFGCSIGGVSKKREGEATCGVGFYDVSVGCELFRVTVFDTEPPSDFGRVGKALLCEGGEGGISAAVGLSPSPDGYSVSVSFAEPLASLTTLLAASAYLLHELYGAASMRLSVGEIFADCTVTHGGVSVFDTSVTVSALLSRHEHYGSV